MILSLYKKSQENHINNEANKKIDDCLNIIQLIESFIDIIIFNLIKSIIGNNSAMLIEIIQNLFV